MTIGISTQENAAVFALEGRLDALSAPQLESGLAPVLEAAERDVTLDISQVQYISSAGLRVFLLAHKKCVKNGKVFSISGANRSVREILDITGYSAMMNIL